MGGVKVVEVYGVYLYKFYLPLSFFKPKLHRTNGKGISECL